MSAVSPFSVGWLRRCFSTATAVPATKTATSPEAPLIPAAVLVPIIARASGMTVLFTRRATHLRDHAGQVSFPGGRCEVRDATPIDTALRESSEEVGIESAQVEVLGILPDHCTSTGFRITPVVGLVAPPLDLRLDDFEVEETFEVPLEFLLDAANYRRETVTVAGRPSSFWAVPWRSHFIWGATASILVSLRSSLAAPRVR